MAEIILLRLSILLENSLKILFCKIACSAVYLDGSAPMLLLAQRSAAAAISAMQTANRARPRTLLWNDGSEIRENVRYVIAPTDNSISVMRRYAPLLTEVRYIRNHVAHRNDNSTRNYRSVVRKYYGANLYGIGCGTLLLSSRVSVPPLLEILIRQTRAMMNDLVKAQ